MTRNTGQFASWPEFFQRATGHSQPRRWQTDLADGDRPDSRLIRIPTGLGKTEGVLTTWMWHAVANSEVQQKSNWPRRLVWCLPMRVLVEQTVDVARKLVEAVGLNIEVQALMGGLAASEWHLRPEQPAILIGTQDMLLSRALNRGYAAGRARWPQDFGLLNHDCLWVMDEVQLMDVGLATSAQLQAYRDRACATGFRPCATWWMSATLQSEWLRSVDTADHCDEWFRDPCEIDSKDRGGGVWNIEKSLTTTEIPLKDAAAFAALILERHTEQTAGEHGRITLVVCNTVNRAIETHTALQKAGATAELELVHSRFRPHERQGWKRFLNRDACSADADRIIVATQVVEAGVDISAGCLVTELAPWPSLVQRFGRCARYGGSGQVVVVDRGQDEKTAPPYEPETLASAWAAVQQLDDVGLESLATFEDSLNHDDERRQQLYPYEPAHLLMEDEFTELFDTTPDLTGADLDISRFIRSGEERDLQVFWVDLPKNTEPDVKRQPLRDELCTVPFLAARDWLCGVESKANRKPKLLGSKRAWIWDWIEGEWQPARREMLLPGRIVCVAAACGGYLPTSGFAADSTTAVPEVPLPTDNAMLSPVDAADMQQDGEPLSQNTLQQNGWKTIAFHSQEVVDTVTEICTALGLPDEIRNVLELAARWHDLGKAHAAFRSNLKDTTLVKRPDRYDLAKGPDEAWVPRTQLYRINETERRPGFRHELASALALFSVLQRYQPNHAALLGRWTDLLAAMSREMPAAESHESHPEIQRVLELSAEDFDLLVYLTSSHHGKVRVALHAAPADQEYQPEDRHDKRGLPIRGVRNGDVLPAVALTPGGPLLPELTLTLEPAALGLSYQTGASWRERTQQLIARYGPSALGFLEAILRAADVRASRSTQPDPEALQPLPLRTRSLQEVTS